MRNNKGFTLIELMVVILIIAILAAVLAPLIKGRVDAAKWSEGRAGIGTIATAARAYWAEHQGDAIALANAPDVTKLFPLIGLNSDLDGKYFTHACYLITWTQYDSTGMAFNVKCTAASSTRASTTLPASPVTMTLTIAADGSSTWSET